MQAQVQQAQAQMQQAQQQQQPCLPSGVTVNPFL
jgi:hypothetical protein